MKTELVHQDLTGRTYGDLLATLKEVVDEGDCCGFAAITRYGGGRP